jgi:hypothetical protein
MRRLLPFILLWLGMSPVHAAREQVGDWQFDTRSEQGRYAASTYSANGHYGKSILTLSASPKKQGSCTVQLGYSLFGPYAVGLKGRSVKARVDREAVRSIHFHNEQAGRTREGIKFTTGLIDLDQREGQNLVADMLEGKWLRIRLDEKVKIERFSLAGFSRAARVIFYFCKTPNAKDRYPLDILLKKQNDEEYL